MGVGGAMSRTAVNSSCNVKSPLSGFLTTAVVLISIYKLVGTLYWIPKATLAAIIITAVWPLISSPQTFYKYWKISLADFISSMIAFWVSLFVSTEIGIASSVGFNIVYCILRQVFTRTSPIGLESRSELRTSPEATYGIPPNIPADTRIFLFNESVFFPNAYQVKTSIMDNIQTHHQPIYNGPHGQEVERNWSVIGEQRVKRLRKQAKISDVSTLPPIELVILDFTRVNHLDYTALSHLSELVKEVRKYGGRDTEIRFVGISNYARRRFERGGWIILNAEDHTEESEEVEGNTVIRLYKSLADAVTAPRLERMDEEDLEKKEIIEKKDSAVQPGAEHKETV